MGTYLIHFGAKIIIKYSEMSPYLNVCAIINSNTAYLYRQWRKPVIYSATNHWAEVPDAIWHLSDIILTLC